MSERIGRIYLLTFPNGKGYVGQTVQNTAVRLTQHAKAAINGGQALYRAWRKHGAPTLTVLFECAASELDAAETTCISALRTFSPNGYNLTAGGRDSPLAISAEARAKLSAAAKGRPTWNKGLKTGPRTAACREKISAAKMGHVKSAETRARISAARSGLQLNGEHRRAISLGLKGRSFSAERRARISAGLKGKPKSAEHRVKLSVANARSAAP